MKHLWEVDHPYYCNEGNYFSNECGTYYKTWQDFIDEWGDADLDYNLVFRWDWSEDDGDEGSTYNGDDYYRNGKLKIFFMLQRKGIYQFSVIEVCRADEPAILAYLEPHFKHLMKLWEPLALETVNDIAQ